MGREIYIKLKTNNDDLESRLENMAEINDSEFERAMLRADIIEHISELSSVDKEKATEFVSKYKEKFSDVTYESLMSTINRDESGEGDAT
jgi:hypothetical protein